MGVNNQDRIKKKKNEKRESEIKGRKFKELRCQVIGDISVTTTQRIIVEIVLKKMRNESKLIYLIFISI